MTEITIHEFAKKYGQVRAAQMLGMAQASLNKALRYGRNIVVEEHPDGSATATETKPFPSTLAQRGRIGGTS